MIEVYLGATIFCFLHCTFLNLNLIINICKFSGAIVTYFLILNLVCAYVYL